MSKSSKPVDGAKSHVETLDPVSNRDFAARFADTGVSRFNLAQWYYNHNGKGKLIGKGDIVELEKDSLPEIVAGILERIDVRSGTPTYARTESTGTFKLIGDSKNPESTKRAMESMKDTYKMAEFKDMSLTTAFTGYTGQQFGKVKKDDPALYELLKDRRSVASKRVSENLKLIREEILRVHYDATGTEKRKAQRSSAPDFAQRLSLTDDKMIGFQLDKLVRTAQKRGDTTAHPEWFRVCWADMVDKYQKGPSKTV